MKVSLSWLKELVDYKLTAKELADQLSLISIGVKDQTDNYLELDLTYNRGDLLSMRGVAREVAAITGSSLMLENPAPLASNLPRVLVEVADEKLSPVYCVARIEGLKVEASNQEWIKKLADSGIRSINNVADITNLMMLEFGQPMHAFDAAMVADKTLVVRPAKAGETLLTLDGKTRKLDSTDLLIADTNKPLGLAGVMGGKDSEISDQTSTIFLEAAIFDPITNRTTSKRHGLHSEASKRFQHGLTKSNLLQALAAAIKMYEGLGGKLTALTLTGNLKDNPKTVTLTSDKLSALIGINIPADQIESSLQSLGFSLKRVGANLNHLEGGLAWHVISPYWRLDINIEEDLIEEVARMYGYEKIPAQPLTGNKPGKLDEKLQQLLYNLKTACKDLGLTEVQTYSFFSSKTLPIISIPATSLVKIANPISAETEYMRQKLWPNLLEVLGKNLRQGFADVAIFEIGKIYEVNKDQIQEGYKLAIALCNNTDNPLSELYSITEKLLKSIKGISIKQQAPQDLDINLSHPNRFFILEKDNNKVGVLLEIHLKILNQLGIEKRVAILEVAF